MCFFPEDRCLVLSVNGGAVAEWNTKNPDKLLQAPKCADCFAAESLDASTGPNNIFVSPACSLGDCLFFPAFWQHVFGGC